jgi:hypothetical protein
VDMDRHLQPQPSLHGPANPGLLVIPNVQLDLFPL